MYTKVEGLRAERKMTLEKLASEVGCTLSTMSLKLAGKSIITLDEAVKIKKALNTDLPLEQLFATSEEVN